MDGLRIAMETLRSLSRSPLLSKSERDAVRYALAYLEDWNGCSVPGVDTLRKVDYN